MKEKIIRRLLRSANVKQVDAVLKAAGERRGGLFPQWEVIYLSLPKNDPEQRLEMLRQILKIEENNQWKDSCF